MVYRVGVLLPLISNQATPYEPAWTTYFSGQTKCAGGICFAIGGDGMVMMRSAVFTWGPETPIGRGGVGLGPTSNCSLGTYAEPVFTADEKAYGRPPSAWRAICWN